jgi:DNA-binding response OmpR family regulator
MTRSILIVEDDDNIRELLGCLFRRAGLEPVLLRDGRAAEEHVAASPAPAVALLDVMLPYRDGFAVARAIRADARWRDVPLVVLSVRAADVDVGRSLGVSAWVPKPFHPHALVERVMALLDGPRSSPQRAA